MSKNSTLPQFGGVELNLFKLYRTVTSLGGALEISQKKNWKKVIDAFKLPKTATSATFTLRSHYIRFLLAYEQKYFFNKNPEDGLPDLPYERRGKRYISQTQQAILASSQPNVILLDSSDDSSSEPSIKKKIIRCLQTTVKVSYENERDAQNTDLLTNYKKQSSITTPHSPEKQHSSSVFDLFTLLSGDSTEMDSTRGSEQAATTTTTNLDLQIKPNTIKQKIEEPEAIIAPSISLLNNKFDNTKPAAMDFIVKRIIASFSSGDQDEISFALNSLMLSSLDSAQPFSLSQYPAVLPGLIYYLQICLQNIPTINWERSSQNQESVRLIYDQNANHKMSYISNYRAMIGGAFLLEQLRSMLQIIRNLSCVPANAQLMSKNGTLIKIITKLFSCKQDPTVFSICLEVLVSLSADIHLQQLVPHKNEFCCQLFTLLTSKNQTEVDHSITILCKLLSVMENEQIIEGFLPMYIDEIPKILQQFEGSIQNNYTIKRILKFICYLTNKRPVAREHLTTRPHLIGSLVQLLINISLLKQENTNNNTRRSSQLAAITLSNLAMMQNAFQIFKQFEQHLKYIASSDQVVCQVISGILTSLQTSNCIETIETPSQTQLPSSFIFEKLAYY